jgi:preprotein translocase subunit SecG|tara:strand:+ start:17 stop:439 length:423 start_codon:yes stop_codon:yes gene_type:complete
MNALFINLLTLVLLLISFFVILLVLMQKNSQSSGMGSALGGGLTESTFGADSSNILTKVTIYTSIAFFIISLIVYLLYQSAASEEQVAIDASEIAPVVIEANETPTILVDETDDVKVIEESGTDTSSSTIIELTPKTSEE